MAVAAAWIEDAWIYSQEPTQHARYWIHDNWIWDVSEPDRPKSTGYWISQGWIFGPEGASDVDTGFFLRDGWIYGPSPFLPFGPRSGATSPRMP